MVAEYDSWAQWYDLLHPGLPGEAEFYVMEAARKPVSTLEIGCGTGRIAIPMAMSGVHVTGLDVSRSMLRVCRQRIRSVSPVKGSLELACGDMRCFDLGRTFQLVVMPYRTFMHCLTVEDQLACLGCVRRHLEGGGEFILNLWAANPSELLAIPENGGRGRFFSQGRHRLPNGGRLFHYVKTWREDYGQLLHEHHRVIEKDSRGEIVLEKDLSLTRTWFSVREMEHLLVRAGFRVRTLMGSFDEETFGKGSHEMIWRLERN
jgi:SAM-dependent methyltransferase